jgi:hypothetical protein
MMRATSFSISGGARKRLPCARESMRVVLATLAMVAFLQAGFEALRVDMSRGDIERALKLARAPEQTRARFHAPYITRLDDATVEEVQVVTEFRRYVLTAEQQLALGRWMFAQGTREAEEALRPWKGRLSILVRFRFHPQNNLDGIPPYESVLGDPAVAPLDVIRTPINAARSRVRGDLSTPLLGATIETVFSAAGAGQGKRPLTIRLTGRDVKHIELDLSVLE